jgi:alpha-beta hydrolase superfamily lysophospholipase
MIAKNLLNRNGKLSLMGHSMGGIALMEFTKRYNTPEIQKLIDRIIIVDAPAVAPLAKKHIDNFQGMLKRFLEIDMTRPI